VKSSLPALRQVDFPAPYSERLSRCGFNALRDVEHLGLLVEKKTLAARLLVQFSSLKSLVAEHFQENDLMDRYSKEELADYLDDDGFPLPERPHTDGSRSLGK
jgi:hypothetical protein